MKYIDADKKAVKEITKTVRKEITSQVKEMMDSLDEKIAKATKSWKGVDVDKFMDEMRGREPDVDLEEAAQHHSEQYRPHWPNQVRPVYDSFIAGAKWQKEQDDRLVDIIYQQGIEKGKDEIRKTLKRKEKK